MFPNIAVMQSPDLGKLLLVGFVPELGSVRNPSGPMTAISIRHLLTHRGGVRGATWPWAGDKDWHPHEPTQWSQLVAMRPCTETESAPGVAVARET